MALNQWRGCEVYETPAQSGKDGGFQFMNANLSKRLHSLKISYLEFSCVMEFLDF